MKTTPILLAVALTFGLTFALPRTAHATPSFPDVIASHLALAEAPACSLCHAGQPARGTVTTPFGTTARSRGLVAYDEASLRLALDAIAGAKKDSDGDGAADIDELKSGEDPNGAFGDDAPVPEYGCRFAARAREPSIPLTMIMVITVAAALGLRRIHRNVRRFVAERRV